MNNLPDQYHTKIMILTLDADPFQLEIERHTKVGIIETDKGREAIIFAADLQPETDLLVMGDKEYKILKIEKKP